MPECNKCKNAGFPGQMFVWKDDPSGKKRPDGSPWGIQTDPDTGLKHIHAFEYKDVDTPGEQKKITEVTEQPEDTAKSPVQELRKDIEHIIKDQGLIKHWLLQIADGLNIVLDDG